MFVHWDTTHSYNEFTGATGFNTEESQKYHIEPKKQVAEKGIEFDNVYQQRHYFANKSPSGQGYGFSCGHVWM